MREESFQKSKGIGSWTNFFDLAQAAHRVE
jgi:hypothetical protein